MTKYFRLTAYEPSNNITMILDSNGAFEKKWQFSAFIIAKGCKIINVTDEENMIDINCGKMDYNPKRFRLMAAIEGEPKSIKYTINNVEYDAMQVGDKIYIPQK